MLSDDQLLTRQDALQREARAFLEAHRVEETVAAAGPVLLVGSYVTGLMVWRDVDVCVDAHDLDRPSAWQVVGALVLASDRVRYEHHREPDDQRHYFVLGLAGWKLDLSLFTAGIPPEVDEFQKGLIRQLDRETRVAILRLKEAWHVRPEYPETIGGFEIASAVLAGARNEAEVREWLQTRS